MYIVTMTQTGDDRTELGRAVTRMKQAPGHGVGPVVRVSRRAVVTLDQVVYWLLATTLASLTSIRDLPAGGGTITLSDGEITVESLSPLMLASRCGASSVLLMECLRKDDFEPLATAYNERHGS